MSGAMGMPMGSPPGKILFQVLDGGHLAGGAVGDQAEDGLAQVVGIDAVESGGIAAPAVVAVEVGLGFEFGNGLIEDFVDGPGMGSSSPRNPALTRAA
jgi:hypothetical protein